jgi:hypothetical protein
MKWYLIFLGVFMLNLPKGMALVQYYGSLAFKITNIESFSLEERVQIFENLRNRPEFNSLESEIESSILASGYKSILETKNSTLLNMFFDFERMENLPQINDYFWRISNDSEIQFIVIREFKYRKFESDKPGPVNPWPWTSGGN